MAVEITGTYTGNLNVELEHGPSGARLQTTAPKDNHGDGTSFSPTDLMAAALASCTLTVMGIAAHRHGVALEGATVRIEKHMVADPRRIGRLPVVIHMPAGIDPAVRERLEATARHCPVHRSLLPDVEAEIDFRYPD